MNERMGSDIALPSENPVEKTHASDVKEKRQLGIPSLEDLDALLDEAESALKVSSMSEKEIDELVNQRQETIDRLRNFQLINAERLNKIVGYNPLEGLKANNYDLLVKESFIDQEYATALKKMDKTIKDLEALKDPTEVNLAHLEEVSKQRRIINKHIENRINEEGEELIERKHEITDRTLEHYAKRVEELDKIVSEIESNPRVIERLQAIAKKERKDSEEEFEKIHRLRFQEASRAIQSLGARYENAFKRLSDILGDQKITEELYSILEEKDFKKQEVMFKKVTDKITKNIIDAEGTEQLKSPEEILPWRNHTTHDEMIDFLREKETEKVLENEAKTNSSQAKKLLDQRKKIIGGNEIIRRLVGKTWNKDRTAKNPFWAAFDTRKSNDEKGITAARKKQREDFEKREAAINIEISELISRGGFQVKFPVYKTDDKRKKSILVGYERGAILLEKEKSKAGNEIWKVVEFTGDVNNTTLKIGSTSPLNMSAFPIWIKDAAETAFIKKGQDFVERLVYKEE